MFNKKNVWESPKYIAIGALIVLVLVGVLVLFLKKLADTKTQQNVDNATSKSQQPLLPVRPLSRPALTVNLVQPKSIDLPINLAANGSIAAWQEAIIGAEVNGLRLSDVNVNVGDQVKRGQVLAAFSSETIAAEINQSQAELEEAQASFAEAQSNAERARQVASSGALSQLQIAQYLTAEKTTKARVQSVQAQLQTRQLRLKYTKVLASDDGTISARTATLGAVVAQGQELFRLIRQNRLEWRGEVMASELHRLKTGAAVNVSVPGAGSVTGKVRMIGPTVDTQSRNALVYVDLPGAIEAGLKLGMFARGQFDLGSQVALTVPQESLSLRDGYSYVFRVAVQQNGIAKVMQTKIQVGRRVDQYVEVLQGISASDFIVAGGASFLADGDSVRVAQP
jgi:RND family efflux transporter MFP subunit